MAERQKRKKGRVKTMVYWKLFYTFFLIGCFSFGGGLAGMELIRSRVVTQQMWLTTAEFSDVVSISEMTPGPLGINIASFVGVRVAGVPGTILATLAYVLPAFFIVMVMAWVYYRYRSLKGVQGVLKGLRPAIAAMVLASAVKMTANALWGSPDAFHLPSTNLIALVVCIAMVVLLHFRKLGPVQAILLSGGVGAVLYAFFPA